MGFRYNATEVSYPVDANFKTVGGLERLVAYYSQECARQEERAVLAAQSVARERQIADDYKSQIRRLYIILLVASTATAISLAIAIPSLIWRIS